MRAIASLLMHGGPGAYQRILHPECMVVGAKWKHKHPAPLILAHALYVHLGGGVSHRHALTMRLTKP